MTEKNGASESRKYSNKATLERIAEGVDHLMSTMGPGDRADVVQSLAPSKGLSLSLTISGRQIIIAQGMTPRECLVAVEVLTRARLMAQPVAKVADVVPAAKAATVPGAVPAAKQAAPAAAKA